MARLKAEQGITPGLAVVIVGHDPASEVYVANKAKQTVEVGMYSESTSRLEDRRRRGAGVGLAGSTPIRKIHGILAAAGAEAGRHEQDLANDLAS